MGNKLTALDLQIIQDTLKNSLGFGNNDLFSFTMEARKEVAEKLLYILENIEVDVIEVKDET